MAKHQMIKLPMVKSFIASKVKKPSAWTVKLIIGILMVGDGVSMLFFSKPYNYAGAGILIVGIIVIFSLYNTFSWKLPKIRRSSKENYSDPSVDSI